MCHIHGLRERKVTFRLGENVAEIDFVFMRIEHRCFLLNVKQ